MMRQTVGAIIWSERPGVASSAYGRNRVPKIYVQTVVRRATRASNACTSRMTDEGACGSKVVLICQDPYKFPSYYNRKGVMTIPTD